MKTYFTNSLKGTQNCTDAYIVTMASLHVLVWQSSCESKLCHLNSESICPAAYQCSPYITEHTYISSWPSVTSLPFS